MKSQTEHIIFPVSDFSLIYVQDDGFQEKLAKLVSAIGVELIYGWTTVRTLSYLT